MPYYQLYYHIVWATKNRRPILSPKIEPTITTIIQTKAISLGVQVLAINGAFDHIHLVASIPPTIAVAKFIGQVKGVASTKYNKSHPGTPFYWQNEYGVLSIDSHNLRTIIRYVERQKEHHAVKETIRRLETFPYSEYR